ncbi:MAG: hypothetical protein ACI4CT_06195 [Lachnospiraceae bacterium]
MDEILTIDQIKQISATVWIWFKKYYVNDLTESEWVALMKECNEISNQFRCKECRDLILYYLDLIEKKNQCNSYCEKGK